MPYPEDSAKNAPDHSAPGHHLPKKVNDIYNALMRDHPEYGKEKAMRIAWGQSGEHHEASSPPLWQVVSCESCGCGSEDCHCSADNPCGKPGCKYSSVRTSEEKWIQKAIKRPGQLHKDLGVPEGEKIPEDKLEEALHSDDPKERERAQFAENMKGNKKSNWQVVSLGELQQPGGVGATQEYNPVVDGPNPDGPSFDDNANNSPEQEVALETWVNAAVDMINRGQPDEAILAQLSHDGCPDPQAVLMRAKQQPNQSPVSNEIGQDPFNAPPTEDPTNTGQMEGLSQQPPVTARVRIAGTTMLGYEIERWEDLWGQGLVKVALDEGGTLNVAPTAIEDADETPRQPVSEIQAFIDSLPKVEPTRPNIEARLTNLELIRRAVRSTISKVGFSDRVKLEMIDRDAEVEAYELKEALAHLDPDVPVVTQPYRYNALGAAVVDSDAIPTYQGNPREAGIIWASEGPWTEGIADTYDFRHAAVHYAENHNMTGPQFNAFLKSAEEYVEEHRHVTTEEFTAVPDNEGPAEEIFV